MQINEKYAPLDTIVPERVDQLRIAGILDELSEKFFPFECKFENLSHYSWQNQVIRLKPHLLFVESVWNGFKKTWRGHITQNNTELVRLVNWCKERRIPTVFWNKEDPIHMFTFLGSAYLFDFVFTTDMDCVPLYKRLLGHNRVGVLPFATAIQLFHPIENYARKDAACFAGSYYAKREERRIDFENLADALLENYSLDIYDRDPYPGNPDYTFPERFRPHIMGTLPVDQIDIAYKSYKIGVTLNIVKHSSTMEARRIFELLGCNTLTVSNPCEGINNLFGDLVFQYDDPGRFSRRIKALLADESAYNRLRLLALRKILKEHTYKERLEYLYRKIFGRRPRNTDPQIAVFGIIETIEDARRIQAAFKRQTHHKKKLFLFSQGIDEDIREMFPLVQPVEEFFTSLEQNFDFIACFSARHYYGPNYLVDLALSTRYATVSAMGKSAHFDAVNGEPHYQEGLGAYQLVDQLQADRCIFSPHLLAMVNPQSAAAGTFWFENLPCLAIDPYNFCANLSADFCANVDDLVVNQGFPIEEIYKISDTLGSQVANYDLGYRLSGVDFQNHAGIYNKKIKVIPHPLDYFSFYTLEEGFQKFFIEKTILLENLPVPNEMTEKPNLQVYVNTEIDGNIILHLHYFTEMDKHLGGYLLFNHACTILPVPDKAAYCKISVDIQGPAQGLVKEILLGPRLGDAIKLSNLGAN